MKPTAFDLGLSCFSIFLVSRAEGWKIDEPKFMPKGKKCLTSATTALYASPWCRRSHEEYRANPRVETFKHLVDGCRNLPRCGWPFRWMMVERKCSRVCRTSNWWWMVTMNDGWHICHTKEDANTYTLLIYSSKIPSGGKVGNIASRWMKSILLFIFCSTNHVHFDFDDKLQSTC